MQLRALHVFLALCTILPLAVPLFRNRVPGLSLGVDVVLMAVAAAANLLIFVDWENIITFTSEAGPLDHVLGMAIAVVILDAARRAAGWAIPICVILIFAYVFVGPYMPGIWIHPGFPLAYVIDPL